MSLQVWLPLNGNLDNQGLSDTTITNKGATVSTSGKIGSCYKCGIMYTNDFTLNTEEFSVCYWVKYVWIGPHNSYVVSLNNSTSSDYQFMVGSLGNGTDNSATSTYLRINAASSGTIPIPVGEWHHCCATWKGTTVSLYVDGVFDKKITGVTVNSGATHLGINCRSNSTSGSGVSNTGSSELYLNDVRVYDHCLSAKEVKEISKGLICHYKLDNKGFGNPNLLSNSHFDSRYTVSTWDTSKNGSLCASSWGGYNGGVSNPSTVYHAHLQEHEGDYVYNYHRTSNETWLGISQLITGRVEVSKTYTFSCELKRISGKNYAHGGLYTKAGSSATSNTFVNSFSFSNFSSITDNKWHKYSYTFTVNSSVYMTSGASWYIYGHSGGDGEFLMRRPKLEEGSSATEWTPYTSDSLYTSLGLNSTTEADCSGYLRNANKVNSPATFSESPRYEGCCKFTGIEYLTFPNPLTSSSTDFSISCWVKFDNASDTMTICTMRSSVGSGIALFRLSSNTFRFDDNAQITFSSYSIPINTWIHLVVTRSSSSKNLYINGNLIQSTTTVGDMGGLYATGSIGASSASGGNLGNFTKGVFSDFRIYATALSASDIKELYNTSASVDKNGNMYAYEFKEE